MTGLLILSRADALLSRCRSERRDFDKDARLFSKPTQAGPSVDAQASVPAIWHFVGKKPAISMRRERRPIKNSPGRRNRTGSNVNAVLGRGLGRIHGGSDE